MRKTIIAIAIIAVMLLVIQGLRGCGNHQGKNVWVDNKVSASFQDGAIQEEVSERPELAEVFIDASGSMKPYFRADDSTLVNTISEIKNLNVDGTKMYFLGNNQQFKGLVSDIIGQINKQPNLLATTFHSFFKESVCRLDTINEVIYLVTDGIMSVGRGKTAKALVQLQGEITNSLKGHSDLAVAVFRYEGGYNGDYWNSSNVKITSKECPLLKSEIKRPFYVIALGRKSAIRWLHNIPLTKINNPQPLFLGIHDMNGHKSATLALGDSAVIQNMNENVSLLLELPKCMVDLDASKVSVCNDDKVLQIPITKEGNTLVAQIAPTIGLRPESDGKIKITFIVKNEIPSNWVNSWNTDDDSNGPDVQTTYGLKYLIQGIFDGIEESENMLETDFIYKRQ